MSFKKKTKVLTIISLDMEKKPIATSITVTKKKTFT